MSDAEERSPSPSLQQPRAGPRVADESPTQILTKSIKVFEMMSNSKLWDQEKAKEKISDLADQYHATQMAKLTRATYQHMPPPPSATPQEHATFHIVGDEGAKRQKLSQMQASPQQLDPLVKEKKIKLFASFLETNARTHMFARSTTDPSDIFVISVKNTFQGSKGSCTSWRRRTSTTSKFECAVCVAAKTNADNRFLDACNDKTAKIVSHNESKPHYMAVQALLEVDAGSEWVPWPKNAGAKVMRDLRKNYVQAKSVDSEDGSSLSPSHSSLCASSCILVILESV